MNATASIREFRREAIETDQASTLDLTPRERLRLEMAAQIAAGMLANPNVYKSPGWAGEVPRMSMRMADTLFTLHLTGGC